MAKINIRYLILAVPVLLLLSGPALSETYISSPVVRNELVIEPDSGRAPIIRLIDTALFDIKIESYMISDNDVIKALKKAEKRGVAVHVLLEKSPSYNFGAAEQAYNELKAASIEVEWGNPAFESTHQRSMVVDERFAVIMTMSFSRNSFYKNRDFALITNDTSKVLEILRVFDADLYRTDTIFTDNDLVWSPLNSREKILAIIDTAKSSIDIYTEDIGDKEIEDHLTAACGKGVRVRMLMPPNPANQTSLRPSQENLAQGGVLVQIDRDLSMRGRALISDSKTALIGSQNLTTASLDRNRELGVIISDPGIISKLQATFEKDWKRHGKKS